MVIQNIHMISSFSHSSESSGIGMSMMSLEEMKEAGMAGERLQGAADTGRSAVVRTCSYTTGLCC